MQRKTVQRLWSQIAQHCIDAIRPRAEQAKHAIAVAQKRGKVQWQMGRVCRG
jgi:hypothetical protein